MFVLLLKQFIDVQEVLYSIKRGIDYNMINSVTPLNIQGYVNRLSKLNSYHQVVTEYKQEFEKIPIEKPLSKVQNVTINNKIEVYA